MSDQNNSQSKDPITEAEEAYKTRAFAVKALFAEVYGRGTTEYQIKFNNWMAQDIVRCEYGFFGEPEGQIYTFDESARDRLLAHGRQDAAEALLHSITACRQIETLKTRLYLCLSFVVLLLTGNLTLAVYSLF